MGWVASDVPPARLLVWVSDGELGRPWQGNGDHLCSKGEIWEARKSYVESKFILKN